MTGEARRRPPVWGTKPLLLACASFLILHASSLRAAGAPTQDDVLRSIGQNIDHQTGDPSKLLALLAAAGGLAILLVVISQRRKREVTSRALRHHGKLLREISRAVALKPAELRQLKQLADERGVTSPLTLLLCPSLGTTRGGVVRDEATVSGLGATTAHRE